MKTIEFTQQELLFLIDGLKNYQAHLESQLNPSEDDLAQKGSNASLNSRISEVKVLIRKLEYTFNNQ